MWHPRVAFPQFFSFFPLRYGLSTIFLFFSEIWPFHNFCLFFPWDMAFPQFFIFFFLLRYCLSTTFFSLRYGLSTIFLFFSSSEIWPFHNFFSFFPLRYGLSTIFSSEIRPFHNFFSLRYGLSTIFLEICFCPILYIFFIYKKSRTDTPSAKSSRFKSAGC